MYELKRNCYIKKKGRKIIIGNKDNGKWIRISEENFNKINRDINNLSPKNLDRKYAELIKAGIIVQKNNETDKIEDLASIMIAITNKCNLSCLHCGFSAGPVEKKELSLEEVLSIINNNQKASEIVITGGEPLIHKDFEQIARKLNDSFIGKKTLMTNGTLIDNKFSKLIASVFDEISISIDGATKDSCDIMRGHGVYEKVLSSIELLKKMGMSNITLSMTLTDINKSEEKQFIELCKEINVEPIIRDLFLTGRAEKNSGLLNADRNDETFNNNIDEFSEFDFIHECKKIKLNGKCKAGKNSVYIQYDGGIYPCPVAAVWEKYKIGPLAEVKGSLYDFLIENKNRSGLNAFINISPEIISPCRDCSVNMFCWGCLQEYNTYIEDSQFFSKFCKSQKNNLERLVWGDY